MAHPAQFTIDSNVPVPAKANGRLKYPFRQMRIGDSFKVPDEMRLSAIQSAYAFGKANSRKYSYATVDGGVRIWRIA